VSTSQPQRARPSRLSRVSIAGGLVALAAAAALGAWIDWTWWNPSYGVQIIAIMAVVVGVAVAAVLRDRIPVILQLAIGALVGLGLGLGLGPARERPLHSRGTVTVTLERPTAIAAQTMNADCSSVPSRQHLRVAGGDGGHPVVLENGRGLTLMVSIGDMWSMNREARRDHLGLEGIIQPARGTPMDDVPDEIYLTATEASTLSVEHDGLNGTMTFDGLVGHRDSARDATEPVDLAGTIAWRCGPPRNPPETGAP
jgi:hypothetical protein